MTTTTRVSWEGAPEALMGLATWELSRVHQGALDELLGEALDGGKPEGLTFETDERAYYLHEIAAARAALASLRARGVA